MAGISIKAARETFPIAGRFTIARGSRTEAQVVTASVSDGVVTGRGECVPYARYGETVESVMAQIDSSNAQTREDVLAMAAGAARNAIDCAFWDFEAKKASVPVWELAGLASPLPVTTAYTLSLETPEIMEAKAAENAARPLLKIKLGGEGDLERLEAVRNGAPNCKIIVDANEGWSVEGYQALSPTLERLGVALVEQPLPAADDGALSGVNRPIPLCADESCHDRASLAALVGKYDFINIKLDKTGGLTEALAMKAQAEEMGFQIMVGCMVGSSLAMAPALLAAQGAPIVDLDGPLLLAEDRPDALHYEGSIVHPPMSALWG